jgi:hypothetical protein
MLHREGSRDKGGSRFGRLFGAMVVGFCVAAFVLPWFLHNSDKGFSARLASWITGRPLVTVTAPDVVEKIQRLNRLETVVYSLDTVVESHESSAILPDVLAGDRLLMIVHGQTVAGLDFSKLKPESVQISDGRGGRSIKLTLPPSEVFLTTVDNAKTRVYERQTGLFVRADPNLESATRLRAQGELQQAALSDGILDAASKNGRETVRAMLEGLGFAQVQIQ